MSPHDKEHLQHTLEIIRKIDRGWPDNNYALLTRENDSIPLK
jgi:hypothetical protein